MPLASTRPDAMSLASTTDGRDDRLSSDEGSAVVAAFCAPSHVARHTYHATPMPPPSEWNRDSSVLRDYRMLADQSMDWRQGDQAYV